MRIFVGLYPRETDREVDLEKQAYKCELWCAARPDSSGPLPLFLADTSGEKALLDNCNGTLANITSSWAVVTVRVLTEETANNRGQPSPGLPNLRECSSRRIRGTKYKSHRLTSAASRLPPDFPWESLAPDE